MNKRAAATSVKLFLNTTRNQSQPNNLFSFTGFASVTYLDCTRKPQPQPPPSSTTPASNCGKEEKLL